MIDQLQLAPAGLSSLPLLWIDGFSMLVAICPLVRPPRRAEPA